MASLFIKTGVNYMKLFNKNNPIVMIITFILGALLIFGTINTITIYLQIMNSFFLWITFFMVCFIYNKYNNLAVLISGFVGIFIINFYRVVPAQIRYSDTFEKIMEWPMKIAPLIFCLVAFSFSVKMIRSKYKGMKK